MNSDEVQFIPAEAADLINLFFISFLYFIRSAINTRYLFLEGNHEAYAVGKVRRRKGIRSIIVGSKSTQWIATAEGIYRKIITSPHIPGTNGSIHDFLKNSPRFNLKLCSSSSHICSSETKKFAAPWCI